MCVCLCVRSVRRLMVSARARLLDMTINTYSTYCRSILLLNQLENIFTKTERPEFEYGIISLSNTLSLCQLNQNGDSSTFS